MWEALRSLRRKLAEEHSVPPYVIFPDATLLEMLRSQPSSLSEMAGIDFRKRDPLSPAWLAVGATLSGRLQHEVDRNLSETIRRLDRYSSARAADLREKVWPMFADGRLKAQTHKVFPFAQASAAHEMMEAATHRGKILLQPSA